MQMNMKINFFTCLLSALVVLCLQDGVNAEYCRDDITAGKCFREHIVPFVVGTTTTGCVFGFFLLILSFCLFCKTRVKNSEIDWVHDREPSDWVRDIQNLGMVNNGHHLEPRKQGLGDNKPQYFVSDRSLYSERATSAFPSSNASDIMCAMDGIHDEQSQAPSGYYWAYGGAPGGGPPGGGLPGGGAHAGGAHAGGAHAGGVPHGDGVPGDVGAHDDYFHGVVLPQKERGSEYATVTSSKTVHSAQILNRKKVGSKMTKAPSDGSTN